MGGYLSAQLAQKPDFETAATKTMEYLKAAPVTR